MMIRIFLFLLLLPFSGPDIHAQTVSSNKTDHYINPLGFQVYHYLRERTSNFSFSPVSLYMALKMLEEGSAGNTRTQLKKLLHLEGENNPPFQQSFFDQPDSGALKVFNSAWQNQSFHLQREYFDRLQEKYHADIFSFSGNELSEVNHKANEWVSERTNGKITTLSVPLESQTMLALLNVTYFKSEWDLEFEEKDTRERTFFPMKQRRQKVSTMYKRSRLQYMDREDYQAVRLPYKDDAYSMVLIVPKRKKGLSDIEQKLDPTQLVQIRSAMQYTDIKLYLPKFRIENEFSLNEFQPLGEILGEEADFSGIDTLNRYLAGSIIQKCYLEIDEKKTEAAALSEIVVIGFGGRYVQPPPPIVIKANRPFLFFIMDNTYQTIAFMGRFTGKE